MYYRGTQNKRNAYIGVILESLIFSEIQNRENSGIFSNCGISRYPHHRPCVTLSEVYVILLKFLYFSKFRKFFQIGDFADIEMTNYDFDHRKRRF